MEQDFQFFNTIDSLDREWQMLVSKASESTAHAYAPYSNFLVGASLLLDNGQIITGTNQENAAFPSGMCAERVVLFNAAAQYPHQTIKRLAVVAHVRFESKFSPATSCGSCRQVMLEFESRQEKPYEVAMLANDGRWIVARSAQSLLPFSFSLPKVKPA